MCKRYNGYLAQIGSREEMEALNEYFNQNAENHMFPYWIGTSSNYSSWLWCSSNGGNDNTKHYKEQENSRCTFLKVKKNCLKIHSVEIEGLFCESDFT